MPLALTDISPIDAGGFDADEHVTFTHNRVGTVGKRQNLWRTGKGNYDSFHGSIVNAEPELAEAEYRIRVRSPW